MSTPKTIPPATPSDKVAGGRAKRRAAASAGGGRAPGQPSGHAGTETAQAGRASSPAGFGGTPAETGAGLIGRTRRTRFRLARIDPWSVMRIAFVFALALGVATLVAVTVLWLVLDVMGVFHSIGQTVSDVVGSEQKGGFDLESFLSFPRVLGFTMLVCIVEAVMVTALATVGAVLYNLCTEYVGGVEVTLAEDE